MPVIEQTIDIRAPIDAVFAALTDPRRGPEWNPNIIDVQLLSDLPVREGTSWKQVTLMLGRPADLMCRVVQFRPPHEGLLEISGQYSGRIWTRCKEVGSATRVTQRLEFTAPAGVLGRMASGFVSGGIRREMAQGLERQRAALEREVGEAGGSATT